jgi:hypothetical protein
VVRFARLIDRPVRELGGPAARAACGGNLSLSQWPLKVILTLRTAPIDACAQAVVTTMTVLRSILLFVLAALAEIGGAWLVWWRCP